MTVYLKGEKSRLICHTGYIACWTQVVARNLHSFDQLITNGPLKYDRHVRPNLLLLETRQRQMACKENGFFFLNSGNEKISQQTL